MSNNIHATQANIGQDYFHQPAPNDFAKVQSNLAVAYEQRTANLLKFAEILNDLGRGRESNDILKTAGERLGVSG